MNKKFSKEALIKLITSSQLQAVIHIRSIVNISLKDANEIVNNLINNPNYYDNTVLKITERIY